MAVSHPRWHIFGIIFYKIDNGTRWRYAVISSVLQVAVTCIGRALLHSYFFYECGSDVFNIKLKATNSNGMYQNENHRGMPTGWLFSVCEWSESNELICMNRLRIELKKKLVLFSESGFRILESNNLSAIYCIDRYYYFSVNQYRLVLAVQQNSTMHPSNSNSVLSMAWLLCW